MADIVISGDSSGSVTLSAPAVSGTTTLTLPTTSGTVLTTASTTGINASAITSGVLDQAYGGTGTTVGYNGFKNRIINGAMQIDQRNEGASISTTGFVVDRMLAIQQSGYTTLTVTAQQQSSDVPANFPYAVKLTVGTGQAVSSSGDLRALDQRIEGFNFADFGFGTANAKPFTMSFWVKSSIVGTYPISFFNSGVSRAYLATYTINSANTWEYKTITVAGDTSGTWNTTNGIGLGFQMAVSAGSDNFGTVGSWSGTYKIGVSGMPDLCATSGATFYITGVQIEKGSTATSFDYRPIGTELALCQRYYQIYAQPPLRGSCNSTAGQRIGMILPVVMRATPSTLMGALPIFDGVDTVTTVSSLTVDYSKNFVVEYDVGLTAPLTAGRPAIVYQSGSTTLQLTAEL